MSFICPINFINQFGSQGDFILALSNLLEIDYSNKYEKEIEKIKLPVILDNGAFETGNPEGIDSLITKGLRIKATHIFAPDYLYDKDETKNSLEITKYIIKKREANLKIGAVVQADNKKDWLQQFKEFDEDPDVDLIGLSFMSVAKCFKKETGTNDYTKNRIACLKELEKTKPVTKIHLLGLGNSYEDIVYAKQNCPFVYSNDTSCCFQSGLFEKKLTENLEVPGGKIKEKVNFDLKKITKEQEKNIQYNINLVKQKICK